MAQSFRIKRGANIPLKGVAQKTVTNAPLADLYAVKPSDYQGLVPKLAVKEGDTVQVGSPIFFDKGNHDVKFVSPVSGTIQEVVRGAKRKILHVTVKPDGQQTAASFDTSGKGDRDKLVALLKESGLWGFIRQRPFSTIADSADAPKAIFVSTFNSAPLAAESDMILKDNQEHFQAGIDALKTLAAGKPVHVGVRDGSNIKASNATVSQFKGPHPVGNVGVQIHKVSPINKGETVWYANLQEVITIGQLMNTSKIDFTKVIALAGSEVKNPRYITAITGAVMSSLAAQDVDASKARVISGDVLTGSNEGINGFLGAFDNLVTAIPEGNEPLFLLTKGWLGPGFDKYSMSRAFPTWLMGGKKFDLTTNMNGEERPFVITGQYEKVFPFDIYPMQLLKSIVVNDIESMEKLGIYEVAPEDFALCEYACPSKISLQKMVRDGLDMLQEEIK